MYPKSSVLKPETPGLNSMYLFMPPQYSVSSSVNWE